MISAGINTRSRSCRLSRVIALTLFQGTTRLIGFAVLLLTATFVLPVRFSQVIPALVVMLISFAYLEEDGILLCISLVAALVSLSVTAATIWATWRATGLIEKLLMGI